MSELETQVELLTDAARELVEAERQRVRYYRAWAWVWFLIAAFSMWQAATR